MGIKILKEYLASDIPNKGVKIIYDKQSKKRPAWIWVTGLPDTTTFISVMINGKRKHYRVYLHPRIPLFLPVDYTKDEMRIFYNKYSETYDNEIEPRNLPASELLMNKMKLPIDADVLDLGAGTGLSSIPYSRKGYNVTLADYSQGMLNKAKKRKELKKCKFIQQDIRKLKLPKQYDVITSMFSFGSNTYFDEKEMPRLWANVHKSLKMGGKIAMMGFDYAPPLKLFKTLKSGKHNINGRYFAPWIIAEKK